MLQYLFPSMAVGIQNGEEWGFVKAGNEKRWARLWWKGKEGKQRVKSAQGTEKQGSAEVCLFHTLVSLEFCGAPLCLWMSFHSGLEIHSEIPRRMAYPECQLW